MSQGPPVPSYIFRGHASSVHALHFYADNSCLASGDSDGWIVVWSLATKRPVAVWKGHEGGVMGLKDWNTHRLISHGRDHKLRVWQLRQEDYEGMSLTLPVDGASAEGLRQPWLLHSLSINALNYCAFSICHDVTNEDVLEGRYGDTLFLAAPNGLDAGGIDVFQFPSERRVCKMPSNKEIQTGMVMAVSLSRHPQTKLLVLVSGYETGHVMIHVNHDATAITWDWRLVMVTQAHSQPVLSINVTTNGEYALSSSADAIVAKFSIESNEIIKKIDTKHAGQQDLKIRDDSKIFATAGWDKRIRVYSTKTLKELAVLKWHQEGCYATAFAATDISTHKQATSARDMDLIKTAVDLLRNEQSTKAQSVHWLAAGGKDGKISLWEIY